jgi:hypothetical protein
MLIEYPIVYQLILHLRVTWRAWPVALLVFCLFCLACIVTRADPSLGFSISRLLPTLLRARIDVLHAWERRRVQGGEENQK